MKSGIKSIIAAIGIVLTAGLAIVIAPDNYEGPFKHVDKREASKIYVLIDPGHGPIVNGKYTTGGKQSPEWPNGLKIYEGESNRMLAYDLASKLMIAGIDVSVLNNYDTDMPMFERVNKINTIFKRDSRLLLISLHHNAQEAIGGDYIDREGQKGFLSVGSGGATGTEVYTSPGITESDNFANNYLLPSLKKHLPEIKFRNNGKAKEANFYMLTKTNCRAVLIEFEFMTTLVPDCEHISNFTIRDKYTTSIRDAVVMYRNEKI